MSKRAVLKTNDGIDIAADYYPGTTDKAALLLHMMSTTRESWRDFALLLTDQGYHVLAIDLRGHGESTGGPERYKTFTDEEHQKYIADVHIGIQFLESRGIKQDAIVMFGASIGANLALWYLSEHSEVRQAVLLSPGLNYRGIVAKSFVRRLTEGQRVFFIASEDDEKWYGNCAKMSHELFNLVPEGVEAKFLAYKNSGHGTHMFGKEKPDLAQEIMRWIH
ncbi:alpha/beta fold hydrolase [Candidatus Jorgensenbacteria bacterium]|nr:alpha/beta fold hydrolase [Candidatus Jorgensenbacteria bacterium]